MKYIAILEDGTYGVIDAADFNTFGEDITIMVSDENGSATEVRGKVMAITSYKGEESESASQQPVAQTSTNPPKVRLKLVDRLNLQQ